MAGPPHPDPDAGARPAGRRPLGDGRQLRRAARAGRRQQDRPPPPLLCFLLLHPYCSLIPLTAAGSTARRRRGRSFSRADSSARYARPPFPFRLALPTPPATAALHSSFSEKLQRKVADSGRTHRGARGAQVACGGAHSLVLLDDGSVLAAGLNSFGQARPRSAPQPQRGQGLRSPFSPKRSNFTLSLSPKRSNFTLSLSPKRSNFTLSPALPRAARRRLARDAPRARAGLGAPGGGRAGCPPPPPPPLPPIQSGHVSSIPPIQSGHVSSLGGGVQVAAGGLHSLALLQSGEARPRPAARAPRARCARSRGRGAGRGGRRALTRGAGVLIGHAVSV